MEWNHYAIGGEVCQDPQTGERWAKIVILDRMTGKARSGPMSVAEIDELTDELGAMRRMVVTGRPASNTENPTND